MDALIGELEVVDDQVEHDGSTNAGSISDRVELVLGHALELLPDWNGIDKGPTRAALGSQPATETWGQG